MCGSVFFFKAAMISAANEPTNSATATTEILKFYKLMISAFLQDRYAIRETLRLMA